jgi:hypothetical protein
LWIFYFCYADNFSRSPTSRTIGDTLLLLSTPEADTEYPLADSLPYEDRAGPADIPGVNPKRKEKTFTSVFSRRPKRKAGHDDNMHYSNTKCADDEAAARPVGNAEECATSLTATDIKKGSQLPKPFSTKKETYQLLVRRRQVVVRRRELKGPSILEILQFFIQRLEEMKEQTTELIRHLHPRLYYMILVLKGVK